MAVEQSGGEEVDFKWGELQAGCTQSSPSRSPQSSLFIQLTEPKRLNSSLLGSKL